MFGALVGLATGVATSHAKYEDIVSDLLAAETDCDVAFLSEVREAERDGYPHVEARVHCLDGRVYDVTWDAQTDGFHYRRCDNEDSC